MARRPLLALVGPTAVGKTDLSLAMAEVVGAEIVSIDSMLVYRGMDIGTAKPSSVDRARVPHHLIDVAEPSEAFSVARFQAEAREAVAEIAERGRQALLVGGSGLYFRAIVDDLEFPGTDPATRAELEREASALGPDAMYERLAAMDPVAAARIEPGERASDRSGTRGAGRSPADRSRRSRTRGSGSTLERCAPSACAWSARSSSPGSVTRVRSMLDEGWFEEVRALVERGFGGWLTATQAIGYAELARHLQGDMTLEAAVDATVKRTGDLARRQMAWFRRDPRIRWVDVDERGAMAASEPIMEYLVDPWGGE